MGGDFKNYNVYKKIIYYIYFMDVCMYVVLSWLELASSRHSPDIAT
jgi:hypothetical protein